jgi:hypothetical protein
MTVRSAAVAADSDAGVAAAPVADFSRDTAAMLVGARWSGALMVRSAVISMISLRRGQTVSRRRRWKDVRKVLA